MEGDDENLEKHLWIIDASPENLLGLGRLGPIIFPACSGVDVWCNHWNALCHS